MTTSTESGTLAEVLRWMAEVQRARAGPEPAYVNSADFIAQHGQAYRGRRLPKGYRYRAPKQCFRNAYHLARQHPGRLRYVEGYVLRYLPVHHAWCVDEDGQVVDPTLRLTAEEAGRTEYLGVTLPLELVDQAILLSERFGVLEDWRNGHPMLQQPFTVEAAMQRYTELHKQKGTFR